MTNADRVTVVSSDSHVGPRLDEDLRPYCPAQYLERFDAFTAEFVAASATFFDEGGFFAPDRCSSEMNRAVWERLLLNLQTAGTHDPDTRLAEMDADGVAAEVLYHGSGFDRIPFSSGMDSFVPGRFDAELLQVGYRMYNQWLADFVAVAPERFVGLMYVPMWDVELAMAEATRAADAGLRGVNFPAAREGIPEYDSPEWEPFWDLCEDRRLTLSTHAGVAPFPVDGPQSMALVRLEGTGWLTRRGMQRMVFGGVFERHPNLNVVLTEVSRFWWGPTARDMDQAYGEPTAALRQQVPKPPSEYMARHVFVGAAFMPPLEVDDALTGGYWQNVLWGRDYPHGEGTYKYPATPDEPSMTRACIRWAFSGCPADQARAMLGENAIRAYHLDGDELAGIASRIGPTSAELGESLVEVPDGWFGDILSQ